MSVLEDLKREVEQLPPELQEQVLEHVRSLHQGLESEKTQDSESPEQVEAQATLGHS